MERVEVPVPPDVRVTLVGLSVSVGPVGELDAVSVTVPVKLLRLLSVIVEFEVAPLRAVRLVGFAEMEKSAVGALKNSVIAFALASLVVMVARPQFVSIVLVKK